MRKRKFVDIVSGPLLRNMIKLVGKDDYLKAEKIGRGIGRTFFRASKSHRNKVDRNLKLAFPDKTDAERLAISIGCFEHFGAVMAEFVRSKKRTTEEVIERVTVEGLEPLLEALRNGHGIILASGHFGDWELSSHRIISCGIPTAAVARDANDPEVNRLVMELRESSGLKIISRGDAARPILKFLKIPGAVGLLCDQNSEEAFIPFFGHPCGTTIGPGVMALRTKSPVHMVSCLRTGEGKARLIFSPALEPAEGYPPAEGLMVSINQELEKYIRMAPDQYLWLHDRWKSARKRGLVP